MHHPGNLHADSDGYPLRRFTGFRRRHSQSAAGGCRRHGNVIQICCFSSLGSLIFRLTRDRHKSLSAHWTLDTLKVDPPHLGRRNQASTFRAYVIERCLHAFEIDLLPAWHDLGILVPSHADVANQGNRGIVGGEFEGEAGPVFLLGFRARLFVGHGLTCGDPGTAVISQPLGK